MQPTDDAAADRSARMLQALQRALPGFEASPPDGVASGEVSPVYRFEVSRDRLPLRGIPRLMLTLLGCPTYGPGEKMEWALRFHVDGVACTLSSEKFGLQLYVKGIVGEAEAAGLAERVIGRLDRAQRVLERDVLRPLAVEQTELGNVTLVNQYFHLRGAYTYFRDGARNAYAGKGTLPKRAPGGGWHAMIEQREGFYNTVAMVSAYFSLLEHILVLALPFSRPPSEPLKLREFLGLRWGTKFRRSFDLQHDGNAKELFDRLGHVSEEYRNTYAHGGFDKAGATLAFHIPGIGAVPAVLSDIRNKPQFSFVPVSVDDYDKVTAVLDDVDAWLTQQAIPDAMLWITSTLDVRYDAEFRQEYAQAKAVHGGAAAMLSREQRLWELHANMDY